MAFDPSQPFEVLDRPAKFNPDQPHEVVGDRPSFDPSKPFDVITGSEKVVESAPGAGIAEDVQLVENQRSAAEAAKNRSIYEEATKSFVSLPRFRIKGQKDNKLPELGPNGDFLKSEYEGEARDSAIVGTAKAMANTGIGLVEGLISLPGAVGAGLLKAPTVVQRAASGVFAADMTRHAVKNAPEVLKVLNDKNATSQEKDEAVLGLGSTVLFAGLAAKHSLGGKAFAEKTPEKQAETLATELNIKPEEVPIVAAKAVVEDHAAIVKEVEKVAEAEKTPEGYSELKGVDDVKAMTATEFSDWSKNVEGGFTGEAHRVGIEAIGDETKIAKLKESLSEIDNTLAESDITKLTTEQLDERSILASKRQFFREAVEAAENKGSAAMSDAVAEAHSNPPVEAVDIGKRDATKSTGDGTPTPFEQELEIQWRQELGLEKAEQPPTPDERTYGITQARINEELVRSGQKPMDEYQSKAFKQDIAEANAAYDANRNVGADLVDSLTKQMRPVDRVQTAILNRELATRQKERAAAENRLIEAQKNGSEELIGEAAEAREAAIKRYAAVADVAYRTGSEQGAALAARKALIRDDYTYAGIERRAMAANEGKPLNAEQNRQVAELSKRIEDLEGRLKSAEEARKTRALAVEIKRERQSGRLAPLLSDAAKAARERIKARLAEGRLQAGLDPVDLADHAIVAAGYILKGVDAGVEMVKEFGDRIKPHLKEIIDEATELARKRSVEAYVERRKKQLEASIESKKEALASGDVEPKGKLANRPQLEEIETRLREVEELNKQISDARKGPAESKEVVRLRQLKERRRKQIDELYKKIETKDLEPKKRTPAQMDDEAYKLQAELDDLREVADQVVERVKYDNASAPKKVLLRSIGVWDSSRNILAGLEASPVGRQGAAGIFGHPIRTLKSFREMFDALMTDPIEARAINNKLLDSPEVKAAEANGVHFGRNGARIGRQEEIAIRNSLSINIPVVSNLINRFNVAGTVYLNRMRLDYWKAMKAALPEGDAGIKSLATAINEATGRGSLGVAEPAAPVLARLLFSPRFLTSRFQSLVGHSMWDSTPGARKIIATEYARTIAGMAAFYGMMVGYQKLKGGDVDVELDPRKGFGKIRIGKSYLDPMAGVGQAITYMARTANAAAISLGMVKEPKRGQPGSQAWSDTTKQFVRSKAHPVIGLGWTFMDRKDFAGKKPDIPTEVAKFFYPITYGDMYDAFKNQGYDDAAILSMMAFFGMGLNTYDKQQKKGTLGLGK